jgi:hypothetical protein
MSDRAYHDYDDDRDVITCVTLSNAVAIPAYIGIPLSSIASRTRITRSFTPARQCHSCRRRRHNRGTGDKTQSRFLADDPSCRRGWRIPRNGTRSRAETIPHGLDAGSGWITTRSNERTIEGESR